MIMNEQNSLNFEMLIMQSVIKTQLYMNSNLVKNLKVAIHLWDEKVNALVQNSFSLFTTVCNFFYAVLSFEMLPLKQFL